jgi:hypothetical protein
MSTLPDLQAEIESYRTEAGELAEHFSQVHAQVEADPNLSPTGKREQLEPLHIEVTEQITALRNREKAAVKQAKESLERRVFGLSPSASSDPAKVVSFRDAQARARELEDSDVAEEIYQSALRSGDNILASAVLEKALVRGWRNIRNDYLERNAGTRNDLDDLAALAKYSHNSLFNVGHYMPPRLNLPHSAGFQNIGGHTTASPPRGVADLGDVMGQAAARAEASQYPYGR